jgi:hypothetical protein
LMQPNRVHGPLWPSRPRGRLPDGARPSGREETGEEERWSELAAGGGSGEVECTDAFTSMVRT